MLLTCCANYLGPPIPTCDEYMETQGHQKGPDLMRKHLLTVKYQCGPLLLPLPSTELAELCRTIRLTALAGRRVLCAVFTSLMYKGHICKWVNTYASIDGRHNSNKQP